MHKSKKAQTILFLPNGFGDSIMGAFASVDTNISKVVCLTKAHSSFFSIASNSLIKTIERFDSKPFSQIRLWVKLFFCHEDTIIAPLATRSLLSCIFFIGLFNKKVIVPYGFLKSRLLNIHIHNENINSFNGHQVNYIRSFLGISEQLPIRICTTKKPIDGIYRLALGISCGRLEKHKIPSPEWFAKIINIAASTNNLEIHLFGLSSDIPLITQFEKNLDKNIRLIKHIDLYPEELLEIISKCNLGISGIVGQAHIMSIAQIPQIVVCGVTNPWESGPFIDTLAIIKHDLACGPCYNHINYRFGCSRIDCMNEINANYAADVISSLIETPQSFKGWRKVSKMKTQNIEQIKFQHSKMFNESGLRN